MLTTIEVAMKTCSKCGVEFPVTPEYFFRNCNTKDGLQGYCKSCKIEHDQAYCQVHKIEKAEHNRTHYQAHKTEKAEYNWTRRQTIEGHLENIFGSMKQRCNDPKHPNYKNYGGRGIRVCFESLDDFRDYVMNVLQVDPHELQIDRINNDGNYERGNIRFVTHRENQQNKGRQG